MAAPGLRWHDDWYVLETIAPGITAIGEPRYHWLNWSYLLEGERQALLFDTGPGERNIRPVVEALTRLPLTVLASHLHFDHVGNLCRFGRVAFADLPLLRSFETGGLIHAPESLVLGAWENRPWVPVRAAAWLPLGEPVDLGGLSLELIHTPGHSPDSISLLCRARNILLAADVLYPGPLYAQVPQASLPDYLTTVQRLARLTDAETVILCGHGATPESPAPRLARTGLLDLARTLAAIRDGTCRPTARDPFTYEVNAAMTLLAAEASFAPWQVPE